MSTLSEKARSEMKEKAKRLVRADPTKPVDASGYVPDGPEMGDVATGLRPVSRRAYRGGGKVEHEKSPPRADRKPRKAGGQARELTPESLVNRDVKSANQDRDGEKHIGGLKRGGRAGRDMGGMALPNAFTPVSRAAGGRSKHAAGCECMACGGRSMKSAGGVLTGGTRPTGGRMARKTGGRTKKGTTVNVIISQPPSGQGAAPPPMPPVGAPPPAPVGLRQGVPPPSSPMGGMPPPPMARKYGGRATYPIDAGSGSGLGRLEKAQRAARGS